VLHSPDLGDDQQRVGGVVAAPDSLVIDPASRIGIPLDFQVVLQFLTADGTPLAQERFDLS